MTTLRCRLVTPARYLFGLLGLVAIFGGCESRGDPSPSSRPPDPAGMAPIAPGPPPTPAAALGRVEVTSAGFQPSRIDVGSDRSIVFRRTTDKTCATSVVFPGLGIEKTLPLSTDVAIDLPPGTKGELAFQCGMGMDRGKVVVR
jgi:hypothetical protein